MELGDTFILVYEGMELGYYNQYSYDATGWMIQGANPSRYKKFFSSPKKRAHTSSGDYLASNSMGNGFFCRGQVASVCEADC